MSGSARNESQPFPIIGIGSAWWSGGKDVDGISVETRGDGEEEQDMTVLMQGF
jgi:hypothetical protein